MPTPPLSLDDLLADSTPPKKPQPATGPISLDDILGGFGDVQSGSSSAPAPRRGIANAIGDWINKSSTDWLTRHAPQYGPSASTLNPLGPGLRELYAGNETRRMVRPDEQVNVPVSQWRQYEAGQLAGERAAAARQYGRAPAEATATPTKSYVAPAATQGMPVTQAYGETLANQGKLATRAEQTGQFSPEKWRQVAVAGMQYANTLHAQGRHDEAEDVLRKAYNAQLLAEGAKEADTHGAIVLSNLLGIIKDPYAGQRRNIAEAQQPGMVATPEEQEQMGITRPTAAARGFEASKDIVAPLVGQAPVIVGGGLVGRSLAAAGAGVAERFGARSIGEALGKLAQPTELTETLGPRVPVTSARNLGLRVGEEVQAFRAALPSMVKRGATEGQIMMGAQQYRMAREQGATVEQAVGAALEGAALNIPFGAAAEVGLGIAGRAAGVGFDPIGHLASQIRERIRGTERVGPDAIAAADAVRADEGQLPISDQMPEAAHRKIATALEELLNQRKTAQDAESARLANRFEDAQAAFEEQPPPAGPEWWAENAPPPEEPLVQPASVLRARRPEANPPLRSAAEIAMERTRPTDEANAAVRMQREQEFTRAARMEAEQAAQEPSLRLEQAAQQRPEEVQGPRTLGETLADAAQQHEQGEPLASDYHDAINKYVDALATVRDLPEGETPSVKQQVALARAKQALNDARKRYGRQLGASAVLALALNDDQLTDDEKKFGGLAAVGLLGVPEGEGKNLPANIEPIPGRFVSRLRTAVENLGKVKQPSGEWTGGKAWDAPRPVADWIGKLKSSNEFSKTELKTILPDLEELQRQKVKMDRAGILQIVENYVPQVERHVLTDLPGEKAPARGGGHMGDPRDITDYDDLGNQIDEGLAANEHGEVLDLIDEQISNRQARHGELTDYIDEQQRDAESTMESHQTDMDSAVERARSTLDDLGLRRGVLDDAIEYLDEHVEPGYVPRGAIDKAMEKIQDELYEASQPGMDEDQLRDELEARGYTIEEVPTRKKQIAAVLPEDVVPHGRSTPGERPNEHVWGYTEGRSEEEHRAMLREKYGEEVARTARIFEGPDPNHPTRWEVRDEYGDMVSRGWGYTEEEAMRDAADTLGIEHRGNDTDFDSAYHDIKSALDDYASARSAWSEAESAYNFYTEEPEEAFKGEYREMEQLESEIGELQDRRTEVERARDQRLAPAEEAPPIDPLLAPVQPERKGSPKYDTYQRIGGGTDYAEVVLNWINPPGGNLPRSAYGGHDYWSSTGALNSVGHFRREAHRVYDTPDISGPKVEFRPGEPEGERLVKSQIVEVRKKRDKILERMAEIAHEVTAATEAERGTQRINDLVQEYARINNDVVNLGKREDQLAEELRAKRVAAGAEPLAPTKVWVMLENQASLAQHQTHLTAPADLATVQAAARAYTEADRAVDDFYNNGFRDAENEYYAAQGAYSAERRTYSNYADDEKMAFRDRYREQPFSGYTGDDPLNLGGALPGGYQDPTNPELRPVSDWIIANAPPDLAQATKRWVEATERYQPLQAEYSRLITARDAASAAYEKVRGSPDRVETPFNDITTAQGMVAAGFLLDAADHAAEAVAWSDAANRVRNAHLQIGAAQLNYDEVTPSAMRRLMKGLGFKDVNIEHFYIKGEGHWRMTLTPEMRAAIRKMGLPLLSVLAVAGAPSESKAQGSGSSSGSSSLYESVLGGAAAGAVLAALMTSKKLRRLVKENRELNRALMIDDLSGLANKRAFSIARDAVDTEPNTAWVALDASQFKKVNDVHGHDVGDQIIAHFGRSIADAAKEVGIPMRGFRAGGDEFAMAVPKGREQEFIDAVERRSQRDVQGIRTQLHGATGETFAEADANLIQRKQDLRTLNPELRRATDHPPASPDEATAVAQAIAAAQLAKPPDDAPHLDLHANPIGPAMRQLARYPSAAALAGLGALMGESDNENIRRAGVPTMVLAAMSVIGSHRLAMAADVFGKGVVKVLGQTNRGRRIIEYVNPDVLLSPEAKKALEQYRQTQAYGRSVALEHSRAASRLGPTGDRAVSDVIENEGWEDTSQLTPQQMTDVLTVAAGIEAETRKLTQAKVATGVLKPTQVIPNYLKREYAYFDVLDALADHQGGGTQAGKTIGAATKSRVLDEPIRAAEAAMAEARSSGDAQKIKAAEDALTEAQLVQQQNRTTLGEIREASYRVGKTFDQGWHDVAAAKLHEQLRNVPGAVHPEYLQRLDDFLAARDLFKNAQSTADRDAAKAMMDRAYIEMREISDRYKAKDGDYRTLPDTRSYGVLRGMPVERAIHREIAPQFDPGAWDSFLNFWKQAKTIFNPGTSIANVASNVGFAHMEGLPIYEQPKYLARALKDLKAYGPATRHLSETGVLEASATFSPNEIRNPAAARTEAGLSDLFQTTRPETQKVMAERGLTPERIASNRKVDLAQRVIIGGAVGGALMADEENPEDTLVGTVGGIALGAALTPKVRALVRRGYANEDNLFRLALYLKKLDDGIPPKYAAQYAKAALGDMSGPQSPLTQQIRRVASPFFLYPLRAIPRFAQQAIDHPWRYMTLVGAIAAVDLYSQSQVGAVPERDLAPADRRDMFGYFLPGFTQLPMVDPQGNKGGVDMARWTPLSSMTSSAPAGSTGGALTDEFPQLFQPSGPLLDIGGRLASNIDPFSGKPLIKKDYPTGENVANILNQAGEVAAPSFLAFHRRRLEEDVRNRDWDKFKNDLLGPTGMRPRYVRPGGEVRQATFQLGEDLNQMKHEFNQAMIANKNPDHAKEIVDQYMRRVTSALAHFRDRIGPPPPALVNSALDTTVPR